jgi:hypothetical protein
LTDEQYDRVEYAARNRMSKEAGTHVLRLLEGGKIHAGRTTDPRALGETKPGSITIRPDQFGKSPGTLAFVLSHEAKHYQQFTGFIGELRWFRMGVNDEHGDGSVRKGHERDANAYSCAVSFGWRSPGLSHSCATP